ncbi:MAG: 5-formyltetrahydrofolate cyclo-ligase [Candidatus Omnitrophica bacterium]|nr:5-formyltetrahydrofolate cyclo-ligase [Candidatus Omnitrophota bacterium]
MLKQKIRKEIKDKLNKQSNLQRLRKSRLIKKRLFSLAEFKRAKSVMFYVATGEEVETRFMMTEARKIGKKIAVPAILRGEKRIIASLVEDFEKELAPGPYGILQPQKKYIREVPHRSIDLVVVPGLAFDRQGRRLGRGGGYYDKFLAGLPSGIPRIGLAFDFQLLTGLPALSHDVSVTKVISA